MEYLHYDLLMLKSTYRAIEAKKGLPEGRTIHDLLLENSDCQDPYVLARNEWDLDALDRVMHSIIRARVTVDETGNAVALDGIWLRPEERPRREKATAKLVVDDLDLHGIGEMLEAMGVQCSMQPDAQRKLFGSMQDSGKLKPYPDAEAIVNLKGRWHGCSARIKAVSRNGKP